MKVKKILVDLWNKFFDIKIEWQNKFIIIKDKIKYSNKKYPDIKSLEETITDIINNKLSVSRYGDGEFKLMEGRNIAFQNINESLQKQLVNIINNDKKELLVCIPDVFDDLSKYIEEPREYWRLHIAKNRRQWYKYLNFNSQYGNAFISRCYYSYKDKSYSKKYFDLLKEIWDGREIVLVEGAKSRLGIGNDLFDNVQSIERILVPEVNAFDKYNEIIDVIKKCSKDKLILIAAGPTATVLAYDLNNLGYQAIDIGHVDIEYEWYLRKADKKIKIENKFVCEAGFGEGVGELNDEQYQNQIIAKV